MLLFVMTKYDVTLYVSVSLSVVVSPCMIRMGVTLYVAVMVSPCMILLWCHPVSVCYGVTLYVSVMVSPCMFLVGVTRDVMSDIANSIIGD